MKNLIFLITIVLFPTFKLVSQIDTTKISQINKKLDDVLEKFKKLENTGRQTVGSLYFYNGLFNVYEYGVRTKEVKIDSVIIIIEEGMIKDIKAYSNIKRNFYTNIDAPIALADYRFNRNEIDNLTNKDGETIHIQELFHLQVQTDYIPEDTTFLFKTNNQTLKLYRNVGINTVLDIRIFTDALSLVGGEGNGLAQTDIKFKQILHRRNIWNRGASIFKYVNLNLNAAKFDSKFKYVDSSGYSRNKFLQQSFVNADFSINAIKGRFTRKSHQAYFLDFGGGVNLGRLSKHKDSINTIITAPYYFIEGGFNLKVSDNIGSTISGKCFRSYMPSNEFTSDIKDNFYWKVNAEIYYNPFGNKANRMFAKLNYTLSTIKKEQKDNYFQLQLGYSVLLTKLLDKK